MQAGGAKCWSCLLLVQRLLERSLQLTKQGAEASSDVLMSWPCERPGQIPGCYQHHDSLQSLLVGPTSLTCQHQLSCNKHSSTFRLATVNKRKFLLTPSRLASASRRLAVAAQICAWQACSSQAQSSADKHHPCKHGGTAAEHNQKTAGLA